MQTGKLIKELRCERHIGQKELAVYLHVSTGTISNYENGVHSPDLITLRRIADYFDVSADYLLGRSAYRKIPHFMKEYYRKDSILFILIRIYFSLPNTYREELYSFAEYLLSKK